MPLLSVRLFGKFSAQYDGQIVNGFEATKVRELFCYLLLYRKSPHPRESLAALFWGDSSGVQSKKNLRQTLWELQTALNDHPHPGHDGILIVEPEWVRLNPAAELWLDVAVFEQAYALAQGITGSALDAPRVEALEGGAQLYQGDLMEGCYQDWCLCERERLQSAYLIMLDKLMGYCESHQQYEAGLAYGHRIMRYERAHESTHRWLMRLYYLSGDRTAALRQYARCVEALAEELGVNPDMRTVALYEQIRSGEFGDVTPPVSRPSSPTEAVTALPTEVPEVIEVMDHLKQLRVVLTGIQVRVQEDIQAVDIVLNRQQ
jgi:DNA-binding SARP family transcriptional activator